MKIYKDMLNEIKTFSINENIFETEENFKKYIEYLQNTSENLFGDNTKLKYNFVKTVLNYCKPNNSYILHKFKEYYGISMLIDIWKPEEIEPIIKCFDENQTYPIQELEISIDFKYQTSEL